MHKGRGGRVQQKDLLSPCAHAPAYFDHHNWPHHCEHENKQGDQQVQDEHAIGIQDDKQEASSHEAQREEQETR